MLASQPIVEQVVDGEVLHAEVHLAAELLRRAGYRIEARNLRTVAGDTWIDAALFSGEPDGEEVEGE